MIYGYIRVSTDKQDNENQRHEILRFCERENLQIDEWIEETISGTKDPKKRKLGELLNKVSKGDLIISGEISRLGRSLFMIMEILKGLLEKEVRVWTLKDNYRLDDSMQSKVLAFAFSMASEIERDMISKRTKEALARKKAEGVILGRPKGKKSSKKLLTGKEDEIIAMTKEGCTQKEIAKKMNVHRLTVAKAVIEAGVNASSYRRYYSDETKKQNKKMIENQGIIFALLDHKKSIKSIARMFNLDPYNLGRWIDKNYKQNKQEGKEG
jgi:DNA invertase Pin-like site-specific DNA recombinase